MYEFFCVRLHDCIQNKNIIYLVAVDITPGTYSGMVMDCGNEERGKVLSNILLPLSPLSALIVIVIRDGTYFE